VLKIADVVKAALLCDGLVVRQWVADCRRERVNWTQITRPIELHDSNLSVAAGLVEMMAAAAGQAAPAWTSTVPGIPATKPAVMLIPEGMSRTRLMCEQIGPEPLRKRRILAPPDYLTIA
jgi:hypothetical protein